MNLSILESFEDISRYLFLFKIKLLHIFIVKATMSMMVGAISTTPIRQLKTIFTTFLPLIVQGIASNGALAKNEVNCQKHLLPVSSMDILATYTMVVK